MVAATLSQLLDLIDPVAKRRRRVMFSGPLPMRRVISRRSKHTISVRSVLVCFIPWNGRIVRNAR